MSSDRSRSHRVQDTDDPNDQYQGVPFMTQTKLLFVKNWLTKRRTEPKKLLGELLLPVLYLVILSFLVRLEKRTTYPEVKESFETPQNVLNQLVYIQQKIYIVPNNTYTRDLTELMNSAWENSEHYPGKALEFQFYPDVTSLVEAYATSNSSIEIAVVFSDSDKLAYTIRINPDRMDKVPLPSTKKVGRETCRNRNMKEEMLENTITCPVNGYFYSNFLALQYLVDQALIMKTAGTNVSEQVRISVEVENYPKAEFTAGMSTFLRVIIPLYCIIPLTQLINTLLILIVTEKENKIKDGLRMIGVSDVAYWCSWFGIYGIMATIFAAMFTLVMHFMNVLKNINPVILFLLFLLFGLSIITFAFALTPFFHKPKTAGAVGTLVMQFTGMLFMLQTFIFDSASAVIIPLRLISSVAFTTAIDDACAYEFEGGIELRDLLPGRKGAGIFYSLIFLIFDIFLYGLLAVYLDNIIPNEYGIRKHPLFCFNPSFWFGSKNSEIETESMHEVEGIVETNNDDVEKVHPSMIGKEAIRIRNLSKTYGSWPSTKIVQAVKQISLDIYEGHITAILGRNGAGKSTLVNMMTGLIAPTKGRCVVFGFDISDPYDLARLRRMTGVCMQQDLHFNALTAREHLQFYGRMRGIQKDELDKEINSLLEELQLSDQRNVAAGKLSGGQKRKLSVGIALIGSPQIILLDEPSAGVDPVSRRHLWSLLQKKKEGRVILLTTHFMDEADVLADRKAIIHDGRLKCVGSSLFLKNRFGVGYYLTIEMEERNLSVKESDDVIRKWIPGSLLSRKIIASEVKYALPHAEVHQFAALFADIEELIASPSSSIKSYGVSMTTLEEVFLKISNDLVETASTQDENIMPHRRMSDVSFRSASGNTGHVENPGGEPREAVTVEEQNLIPNIGETRPNSVAVLWAICLLRIRRLIRNPQSLFFMVFMPVIFVAVGFALVKTQNVALQDIKLSFIASKGSDIYPSSELNIAVSSNSNSEVQLKEFLRANGFNTVDYSGFYSDLLHTNSTLGTMAALSLRNASTGEVRINGTYLHVPVMVLNMISQYSLNLASKNTLQKITTINQPFPSRNLQVFDQTTFYAVFLIAPAFTFAAVGMVMEIVHDREIKARNHLRVNGLSLGMYFSSIFLVFGVLSLLVTIMQIVVVYAFSVAAFMNPYAMTVVVILLVLFIAPCLLFSAIFSYLFDRMESAQTVFSQMCSWMGSIFGITLILVDAFATNRSIPLILHIVFSAVDIFYIPFGIFYYTNKQYLTCTIFDTCDQLSFKDYMGTEFLVMGIAMLIQIPVFLAVLVIMDVVKDGGKSLDALKTLIFKTGNNRRRVADSPDGSDLQNMNEDEDVRNEKLHVLEYFHNVQANEKCVVGLKDLRKSYNCKKIKDDSGKTVKRKQVLHGIDFLVEEGEVFGLLGHNGAGKTTLMKIIIAEEASDSGKVRLCGHDINSNLSDAFSKLGYCPQHDALWDNISMREHMELYAIIRGVQIHMRSKLINHFLKGLQITEHSEKRTKELSGGTKRKLSYCMSMLGAPKIVLLDEPSSGMDIMSKRFLWNTVLGTFKDSRGAILTTHSMEEADALCTKIAIMVKGSLLCIGSPQHLKSKYGVGYTLEIKLKFDEVVLGHSLNSVNIVMIESSNYAEKFSFVQQHFPDSTLSEMFGNRAVYSIPTTTIRSISQTFALLEELKRTHDVEEYSFSQTTLEQVFLQFAKDEDDSLIE